MEINIKQGLGDLTFGMPVEKAVSTLGQADEVENIDNAADESTTVLHYNEHGLTLFFEGDNPTLACIDIADEETTLWGEKPFDMDERQLVRLMVGKNYTEQDVDDEDWGERRIGFPEGNIDFYYDEGELMSIVFGA